MRSPGARAALIAGVVAAGVVLISEQDLVAVVALAAAFVLLPAALLIELARRDGPARLMIALVAGLFACGVLVFADEQTLAAAAFATVIVLLPAIGFAEGHLRAVLWAAVLLVSAIAADVLWWLGWDPFDRSGDYEAIAQSPFVLIGLPCPWP